METLGLRVSIVDRRILIEHLAKLPEEPAYWHDFKLTAGEARRFGEKLMERARDLAGQLRNENSTVELDTTATSVG